MSRKNSPAAKRQRSMAKAVRQAESRKSIPHGGVCVTVGMVKNHRYLAQLGSSYSPRVANCVIG